jgi:hypothetical protein
MLTELEVPEVSNYLFGENGESLTFDIKPQDS